MTVAAIRIDDSSTLNAGSYTLTLSDNMVLDMTPGATFNAGASTVRLTDANHRFDGDLSLYNLQWATPLTAPRTLDFYTTLTKLAGGTFNLDGTPTNPVTFAGNGVIVGGPITVYYCASSTVTGINCVAGGPSGTVPVQPVPTPHFQVWGWNVAGSLADLVTQTGVQWWPGLTPPAHVGVAIDLGNPFSTGYTTGHIMRRPRAASSQPSSTEQP